MLKPIATENELKICLEELLERKTGKHDRAEEEKEQTKVKREKPDYVIFCHDLPLSVIEVKNVRCLIRSSITQCIKQLLALHTMEQDVRKSIGPLFGIVTDTLHFSFIKLTKDKQFVFERENYGVTCKD